MVKTKKSDFSKNRNTKGFNANGARAKKINASTAYNTCSEQLSPFGGLLPLMRPCDGEREKMSMEKNILLKKAEIGDIEQIKIILFSSLGHDLAFEKSLKF